MKKLVICRPLLLVFVLLTGYCRAQQEQAQGTEEPASGTQQTAQDTGGTPPEKGPPTILDAQEAGTATITASGVDVEKMHVSITSTRPQTLVIPAGMVFSSGESGTQTMMSAKTVSVVFAGSTAYDSSQAQDVDIEVYCINRMLDAPTGQSTFVTGTGSRELDPVRRLAACLESKDADHYSRQLAIWVTSDHFIDMTEDEVRKELHSHAMELLNSEKGLEVLRTAMPGVSEEQLREIRENPEYTKIVAEAAATEVDKEIEGYKTRARALLEQCGFDVATSRFFRGSRG